MSWHTRVLLAIAIACSSPRSLHANEPTQPVTLQVLSYNIHHGEGLDGRLDLERIGAIIRGAQPDLVALQEVDQNLPRTDKVDQSAELARLTGMHVAFGGNYQFDGGDYGNAVLSRRPIRRRQNHRLPMPTPGEPRGLLEVEVELDGGEPLVFLAAHLDHRPLDRSRRESAEAINELAAATPNRLSILAGDLNAVPESEVLKILRSQWHSPEGDSLLTSPAKSPRRQIDYVLLRPASRWRVVDVKVLDEPIASDHRPLLVKLELLPRD
jgi:endonuclease/exonuclease/phosphatase family metal-dependent hydrolase